MRGTPYDCRLSVCDAGGAHRPIRFERTLAYLGCREMPSICAKMQHPKCSARRSVDSLTVETSSMWSRAKRRPLDGLDRSHVRLLRQQASESRTVERAQRGRRIEWILIELRERDRVQLAGLEGGVRKPSIEAPEMGQVEHQM